MPKTTTWQEAKPLTLEGAPRRARGKISSSRAFDEPRLVGGRRAELSAASQVNGTLAAVPMIYYDRTNWYGLAYLCRLQGSLLPRVLPCVIVSGVLAYLTATDVMDTILGQEKGRFKNETFDHPYAFQLFGIVFGYLTVARLNWSYNRYWEGVTHIKVMHSKWADAATQVLAFDRLDDSSTSIVDDPCCRHIVRLFSQLSALATMRLHVESELKPGKGGRASWLDVQAIAATKKLVSTSGSKLKTNRSFGLRRCSPSVSLKKLPRGGAAPSSAAIAPTGSNPDSLPAALDEIAGAAASPLDSNGTKRSWRPGKHAQVAAGERPRGDTSFAVAAPVAASERSHSLGSHSATSNSDCGSVSDDADSADLSTKSRRPSFGSSPKQRVSTAAGRRLHLAVSAIDMSSRRKSEKNENTRDQLQKGLTPGECSFVIGAPCPVLSTMQRIIRAISTRHKAGGVRAPAPIVSRIFQELSNGLLAYNNATKMKEIPVPFAFVQFNAILQLFFIFTAPFVIASFTSSGASDALSAFFSVAASCIVVGGFIALWLVANELEDPFGYDPNDMPMMHYHEEFCASLDNILAAPWMAEDQWVVCHGEGTPPVRSDGNSSPASNGRKFSGGNASQLTSSKAPLVPDALSLSGAAPGSPLASGISSPRERVAGRRPSVSANGMGKSLLQPLSPLTPEQIGGPRAGGAASPLPSSAPPSPAPVAATASMGTDAAQACAEAAAAAATAAAAAHAAAAAAQALAAASGGAISPPVAAPATAAIHEGSVQMISSAGGGSGTSGRRGSGRGDELERRRASARGLQPVGRAASASAQSEL